MFSRRGASSASDDKADLTPEEEEAWHAGLQRVAEERAQALRDPGPTWREWFFYDHLKWWFGLGFLIVDSWVVVGWFHDGSISALGAVAAALSLAAALYLEILVYRFFWRRPSEGTAGRRGRFRPGWTALREVGRWTPEGERLRARGRAAPDEGAPNPQEFL